MAPAPTLEMQPREKLFNSIMEVDLDAGIPEGSATSTEIINNLFNWEVGDLMVKEFKKFMFLVKVNVNESRRKDTRQMDTK